MSVAGRYRIWIMAIFIVPMAIYLFYFALGVRESGETGRIEQLSGTYLEAGVPAEIDGGTYRAGAPGYEIAFYDTLQAGHNTIMSDPGLIFAVIPVLLPFPGGGQPALQWALIDDSGRVYKPISTSAARLSNLRRLPEREILPGTAPDYLVFKARTGGQTFYLKLSTNGTILYWRLAVPGR